MRRGSFFWSLTINWSKVNYFDRAEFGQGAVEPSEALVTLLDAARGLAGVPFTLTSAIRTPDRNREVGGVEDSAHVRGMAADIACPDSRTRYLIVDSLLAVGAGRVGIYESHVHVDVDNDKPNPVMWTGFGRTGLRYWNSLNPKKILERFGSFCRKSMTQQKIGRTVSHDDQTGPP